MLGLRATLNLDVMLRPLSRGLSTPHLAPRARVIKSRYNSTTTLKTEIPKPQEPVSSSFQTDRAPFHIPLPGPAWLWKPLKPLGYPIFAYNRANSRRPYLTQFLTALTIYFLGDLSSQYVARPRHNVSKDADLPPSTQPRDSNTGFTYDAQRSARALIIGGTVAIPSYLWFMYLSRLWPGMPHMRSLVFKIGLNATIFAPIFSSYFFAMQSILSGKGGPTVEGRAEAAWVRVRDTVPQSWVTGCFFWPAVTAFSFTFIAPASRSVFAGVAAIGWQTYIGILNQRAARQERSSIGVEEGIDAQI